MRKGEFFSKIVVNNYNNELERVLDKKDFSINAKNLLLSMIYKVELGFKDYKVVKQEKFTEKQFIEDIINTIENNCNSIKIIEPNSKKGEILKSHEVSFISDEKTKTIVSFPDEKTLLYAIYQMCLNSFKISKNYYILNKTMKAFLKIGNSINTKEIIRDFNGWSWNIEKQDIESYEYNLMFQNLRILVGYTFLFDWHKGNNKNIDYMYGLKERLIQEYGQMAGKKFYDKLCFCSIIEGCITDENLKKYILDEKKNNSDEIILINNKSQYLDTITKRRKSANEKIGQIDVVLKNKSILEKEFKKINQKNKNKIKTVEEFEQMLIDKRQKLVEDLQRYYNLMNPKSFEKNMIELETKEKLLKNINSEILNREFANKELIELQLAVLDCLKYKIENTKMKMEIYEIIYHLRYLKNIPVNVNEQITDIKELQKKLEETENLLIMKAINLKVLNVLSKNANQNLKLIKKVFNITNVINLENLGIEIEPKYNKLVITLYDGETVEQQFEIENGKTAEKNTLKTNKIIKIFN